MKKIALTKLTNKSLAILAVITIVGIGGFLVYRATSLNNESASKRSSTLVHGGSLNIPELLSYEVVDGVKQFELTAQESQYEFVDGVKSDTLAYSGNILGPTIRISEGDEVNIAVKNNLSEQTTSHWHGAIVPADADGGVHNIIQPDETWNARFKVIQEAATLWYHPHQHEETARQVYQGMGGLLIIDDEKSKDLNIPDQYGIDDIPLIIQSKNIDSNGKLIKYNIGQREIVHGLEGNTILINAQIKPSLDATTNFVRFRVLNGSNSDIYNLALSTGDDFYVIASDGGFYNQPVKVSSLEIPNAKRFEILVDVSKLAGQTFALDVNDEPQLTVNVADELDSKYTLPSTTNNLIQATYDGQPTRDFDLEFLMGGDNSGGSGGMGGVYGINGKLFDMERVDFELKSGTTEYWKITNVGSPGPGLYHPFHVHTTQFNIVQFNGKEPTELQKGRHDTIYLAKDETAIIAVPFDKSTKGIFMYHCHILEHEDAGMMGQFKLF